ncbi:MAG TPA: thiamine-phosphate kinase [Sulfurospirillum sp. UBA11407]|nr:MAG TPA: thiamine-phosphate kinase [Sulfurospirillum sp. UBA11407]
MGKEEYFISKFQNATIGDDGAFIDGVVYSKDLFCEDIHFKRSWMSLKQIANKSMLVNISDAIAMNAKPLYALLGLSIPTTFSFQHLDELAQGFNEVAKEYGVKIIGGDTTSGTKLMISVTIVSKTKNPIFRKSLKVGDFLAYTGDVGESKKGLTTLLRGGRLSSKKRFIKPCLKAGFFYEASRYVHSALDISDGLSKDLSRICSKKCGVKFFKKFSKRELCSGEEYEMLFSFDKRHLSKIRNIANKHKTPLRVFGKTVRGRYRSCCKENHF